MAYQSICYIQRWISLFHIIVQVLIHNKRLFLLANSTYLFKFDIFQWEYPNCVVSPGECVDMLDLYRTVRLDPILGPILVTLPLFKKNRNSVQKNAVKTRNQKSKGGSCIGAKIQFDPFFLCCANNHHFWKLLFFSKIIQKIIFSYHLRIFSLHVWKKKLSTTKRIEYVNVSKQRQPPTHTHTCISHT